MRFRVVDGATAKPIPCKLTFLGVGNTLDPAFSRSDEPRQETRAIAAYNRVFSLSGEGSLKVPQGSYTVLVSRGLEWTLAERNLEITASGARLEAELEHVVETPGWLSADFHVHASGSFDSKVPMEARVYEFISDGVDFDRAQVDEVMHDWFGLMRNGQAVTATGNSDTHHLHYNLGGYPRNYVAVLDDAPKTVTPAMVVAPRPASDSRARAPQMLYDRELMRLWLPALGVGLYCLFAACAVIDFGVAGDGGAGAAPTTTGGGGAETSAAGGFGGAGGDGATTATAMGGSTTDGMGGGPLAMLSDSGLVARYYLDEASRGSPDAGAAIDSAPDPLNLPITWPSVGELHYVETGGQRGLESSAAGLDGRASIADIGDSKIRSALDGSQTGTLEVVLAVSGVHESNSRFIHIGTAEESGRFSLSAGSLDELNFYWRPSALHPEDVLAGRWPMAFTPGERVVLHAVLDASAIAAGDRARLYRNGMLVAGNDTETPVELGQAITLADHHAFVLGNREIGVRSFAGTLFYAALYESALTEAEVANNAAVLETSDDKPEP